MFCQKCGKENPDEAKFCNFCGASVASLVPSPISDERRIKLNKEITETKVKIKENESLLGPEILGAIGAIFTVLIIGAVIGIPLIIIAVIWGYVRTKEVTQLKALLLSYEQELQRLG